MKCDYKIIYDVNKDMWNWRAALSDSFMGVNWLDGIDNEKDLKIANMINGLNKKQTEEILQPYLEAKKSDSNSKLNKYFKIIDDDLKANFEDACLALERITRRSMMSSEFTFCLTTFPCGPYFYKEREIYMYISTDGVWGMPIDGFLHEGLHFQFTYYWRDDKSSPVSRLTEDEFNYLNEALTVTLDDELVPLISKADNGYSSQNEFRSVLHQHWKKYHDFDKLVEFGLIKLSAYIS